MRNASSGCGSTASDYGLSPDAWLRCVASKYAQRYGLEGGERAAAYARFFVPKVPFQARARAA
jgi:hypothetical protein